MEPERELRLCPITGVLTAASRIPKVRRVCLKLALRLEGGAFYSATARRILEDRYGVKIGAYSYGSCFVPGTFPPGVAIGRYVSTAPEISIILRNHPLNRLSTHPFFFNHRLGFVREDNVPLGTLTIGHDAWIGHRVIITCGCSRIGIGAVVGAGAVVTRDVPDFAVVAGTPARILRFRFDEEVRRQIVASEWWNHSIEECVPWMAEMTRPIGMDFSTHPLARPTEEKEFSMRMAPKKLQSH